MKTRRHHNNKGYRQIHRGKTACQLKGICRTVFGNCEVDCGILYPNQEFSWHQTRKRNCQSLDRSFGADWVTCLHADNPTALQVCSHEHCPERVSETEKKFAKVTADEVDAEILATVIEQAKEGENG
jgi:hypothetical protein